MPSGSAAMPDTSPSPSTSPISAVSSAEKSVRSNRRPAMVEAWAASASASCGNRAATRGQRAARSCCPAVARMLPAPDAMRQGLRAAMFPIGMTSEPPAPHLLRPVTDAELKSKMTDLARTLPVPAGTGQILSNAPLIAMTRAGARNPVRRKPGSLCPGAQERWQFRLTPDQIGEERLEIAAIERGLHPVQRGLDRSRLRRIQHPDRSVDMHQQVHARCDVTHQQGRHHAALAAMLADRAAGLDGQHRHRYPQAHPRQPVPRRS
ncbi:protein of unknown function [Rhodovastum atsumiense]|nr:protein of unknown function [Rhodovastum atsumiense]